MTEAKAQTPNPMPSVAQGGWSVSPSSILYGLSPHKSSQHDSLDSNSNPKHIHNDHDQDDEEGDFDDDDEEFLPLQGTSTSTSTRDSAWDYLYEAKGGYLITRERSLEPTAGQSIRARRGHAKSSSLDLVARLGGENINDGGGVVVQGESEKEKRRRKKKSWSMGMGAGLGVNMNMNMGKLGIGGGKVREII